MDNVVSKLVDESLSGTLIAKLPSVEQLLALDLDDRIFVLQEPVLEDFFTPGNAQRFVQVYNLLGKGLFPPVRSQAGLGGYCWAHMLVDYLSATLCVQQGVYTILSVEYVMDYIRRMIPRRFGGWAGLKMHEALKFASFGVPDVSSYPFASWLPNSAFMPFQVDHVRLVVGDSPLRMNVHQAISTLRAGYPVAAGLYATIEFKRYQKGFYTAPVPLHPDPVIAARIPPHAVLIVGCVQDSHGCWWFIVRNSYGRWWGVDGHALVSASSFIVFYGLGSVHVRWTYDRFIAY